MALGATIAVQNPITNPVTRQKLDELVSTAKVTVTGQVTADQIAAGAVGTDRLAAGAVTADKIADGAVTAAKIAGGAVDFGAMLGSAMLVRDVKYAMNSAPVHLVLSAGSQWSNLFGGLSVSVGSGQRVLLLAMVSARSSAGGLQFVRDGVPVFLGTGEGDRTRTLAQMNSGNDPVAVPMVAVDRPSAGSYVYDVQYVGRGDSSVVVDINRSKNDYDNNKHFRPASTFVAIVIG